jgi:hypothetical protein
VRLGIAITNYKRDEAVKQSVARLSRAIAEHGEYSDAIRLAVVDNGRTLAEADVPGARLVPNRNLGGTGGFMRGMIHYQDEGECSHVLFMDDDAACEPESIFRSIAILEHARRPSSAVGGAMLSAYVQFMQWESGAFFNHRCYALHWNLDLREVDNLVANEDESLEDAERGKYPVYGAWWFFMFPLRQVTKYCFPCFVRGDDIFFSYNNDFTIIKMNGIGVWQEDFKIKESWSTLYLDIRSHIMHHLTTESLLDKQPYDIVKMVWRFFNRFNNAYFYDTAHAIVLAFNDILGGPDYWLKNIDMQSKRAELAKRYTLEKWRPAPPAKPKTTPVDKTLTTLLFPKFLRKCSAYGHLWPAFMRERKKLWYLSKTQTPSANRTYLRDKFYIEDPTTRQYFIVQMNKKRYFVNLLFLIVTSVRFILQFKKLKKEYKQFSDDNLNSALFWKKEFAEK